MMFTSSVGTIGIKVRVPAYGCVGCQFLGKRFFGLQRVCRLGKPQKLVTFTKFNLTIFYHDGRKKPLVIVETESCKERKRNSGELFEFPPQRKN